MIISSFIQRSLTTIHLVSHKTLEPAAPHCNELLSLLVLPTLLLMSNFKMDSNFNTKISKFCCCTPINGISFATRILNFLIGGRSTGYKTLQLEFESFYVTTLNDEGRLFLNNLLADFLALFLANSNYLGEPHIYMNWSKKDILQRQKLFKRVLERFLYCKM